MKPLLSLSEVRATGLRPDLTTGRSGFTLIEILVAAVVFAIVLILVSQLTTATLQSTRAAGSGVKSDRSMADALDFLAADFRAAVVHDGQKLLVRRDEASGDAVIAMAVEGRRPATVPDTRLMAVQYRISDGRMERITAPIPWAAVNPLVEAASPSGTQSTNVLAEGALRLEVTARRADGTFGSTLDQWATNSFSGGAAVPGGFLVVAADGTNPAREVTVALAGADPVSSSLPGAEGVVASLSSPPAGQEPVPFWSDSLSSGTVTGPAPLMRSLDFSQRTLPLP